MFGLWPSCAYQGCPLPAVFQIRNARDGERILVDFCVLHIAEAREAIKEMKLLREKEDLERLPYVDE